MKTKFNGILTLLLAFVVQLSFAQEKTISGTVVDETNMPLPGATVVIKGTTTGTSTDFDGNYSISANSGDVLTFSFVGYADQNATVGASNSINISLAPDNTLEEVVVTALGIKRKQSEVTSSNQNVKNEEITQAGNPNVIASLTGKVSGLQINKTNSSVNGTQKVVLRGQSSISGSNEALVIIDGARSTLGVLNNLPPEIIEAVNVMKGPQGSALYGAAGANGVIVVSTKGANGKAAKTTIQVTSAVDFEEVSFVPERQTRYGQGWSGDHVSYENGGWGPEFDGSMQPVGLPQADGSYIMAPYVSGGDNIKDFFQTGATFQNAVTLSSSNENGGIILSLKNLDKEFVVQDDVSKTNTGFFKANQRFGKWDVTGSATYYTRRSSTTSSNLFTELLQTATNVPITEFENSGNEGHWTAYYRNPYWMRDNIRRNNAIGYFSGLASVGYEINDNISLLYRANITNSSSDAHSYTNEYIDTNQVGGGDHTTTSSFDTSNSMFRSYDGDFMVNLNYDLTEKISLAANLGINSRDTYSTYTSVGGDNLTIPGFYHISNVTGTPRVDNNETRTRSFATYANVDLGYEDYLFLNLTARNDWLSQLSPDNRSFFYPSAGLSFIPSKAIESIKNSSVINFAKIFTNFTKVGRSNVGAYAINDLYVQPGGYPFGGLNTFVPSTSTTDPLIQNEFVTNYEIGTNLSFFKNRITLDGAYYKKITTEVDSNTTPSFASGASSARLNIGELTTTGYEIDLGFTVIDNKSLGLKWENRLSISGNKTIVTDLGGDADEIALQSFAGVGIFAVEGEEFPMIKGTGYQRDDQGRVLIDPATGNPLKTDSFIELGVNNPDYILGLSSSISFKGFKLAAVMDYRTGSNYKFWAGNKDWLSWSGHLVESAENGRSGFIFPNSAIETSPGVYEANTGVITGGTTYNSYLNYFSNEYRDVTENFVLDATAFKVRELSLSYTVNEKLLKNTGVTGIRIGINARNPFVVLPTENRNYHDPENSNTNGNGSGLAVSGQYPSTATYGVNVNLTF